jgi:hypothetical protein
MRTTCRCMTRHEAAVKHDKLAQSVLKKEALIMKNPKSNNTVCH